MECIISFRPYHLLEGRWRSAQHILAGSQPILCKAGLVKGSSRVLISRGRGCHLLARAAGTHGPRPCNVYPALSLALSMSRHVTSRHFTEPPFLRRSEGEAGDMGGPQWHVCLLPPASPSDHTLRALPSCALPEGCGCSLGEGGLF